MSKYARIILNDYSSRVGEIIMEVFLYNISNEKIKTDIMVMMTNLSRFTVIIMTSLMFISK